MLEEVQAKIEPMVKETVDEIVAAKPLEEITKTWDGFINGEVFTRIAVDGMK